ncbi:energy transducer TonB [Sphingomonas sp. RT2P30]|uniref:energy transducer TonB n=1 Tax=Parasphingomonas halimpatiens TaxID=3096162 RepID=UPI002FCB46AB
MKRQRSWLGPAILLCVAGVTSAHAEEKKGRFFGPEYYPAEALRLRQQGRVVMHLTISTQGAVTACTITTSSGSPSLDADACEKALRRVHFTPAKDDAGKPVESTYDLPMRYVLP